MGERISEFLEADHRRLDALLRTATANPESFDTAAHALFRGGLLRHIAIEEKILFPALRQAGCEPAWLRSLRIDHGALASLLVGPPSFELVAEIASILDPHNALEEGPGGLYALCDEMLAGEADRLLEQARAYPEVRVAAYNYRPGVFRRAADALRSSARQFDRLDPQRPRQE